MARVRLRALGAAALCAVAACQGTIHTPSPGRTAAPPAAVETAPSPSSGGSAVRFAAVGDIGQGNATQRLVGERIAAIHEQRPLDVLLLLGDIVYPDGDGALLQERFDRPWAAVLRSGVPMRAALGNHDIQTRGGRDVMRRFGMPGRWYSFRIGAVAFFALDSNDLDAEQLAWLDAELGGSDAPWRVVFLHEPPYASGHHGSSMRARRALAPLTRKHGVQLVLSGHEHHYERSVPIDGTVYVVAGTGCCLRRVGRSEFTASAASVPGVVVVEATGSTLTLVAVHADGSVVDQAVLEGQQAEAPPRPAA